LHCSYWLHCGMDGWTAGRMAKMGIFVGFMRATVLVLDSYQ
jgi:hypothetical protein